MFDAFKLKVKAGSLTLLTKLCTPKPLKLRFAQGVSKSSLRPYLCMYASYGEGKEPKLFATETIWLTDKFVDQLLNLFGFLYHVRNQSKILASDLTVDGIEDALSSVPRTKMINGVEIPINHLWFEQKSYGGR